MGLAACANVYIVLYNLIGLGAGMSGPRKGILWVTGALVKSLLDIVWSAEAVFIIFLVICMINQ